MTELELEIECPLDGTTETVEIEEPEDGSVGVRCSVCGAELAATFTVSDEVTVDGVEVVDPPSAAGDCPKCGNEASIDEIEDESGAEDVECWECESQLIVRWSDWGANVEVELVEGAAVEVDDESEGEDEEDEGEEDGADELIYGYENEEDEEEEEEEADEREEW